MLTGVKRLCVRIHAEKKMEGQKGAAVWIEEQRYLGSFHWSDEYVA